MVERRDFPDGDALAAALAEAVATQLKSGIAERGRASLAVSGGSTPARFFAALGAREDIDWARVVVTLVDERWVDETSERSNARLVKSRLLQGPAAAAAFQPLFGGGDEPGPTALATIESALDHLPAPFDAVVLGMGTDGHTASFFPGGDTLAEALAGHAPLVAIRAPGAGEPRVTLSLIRLLATKALYVHIEGSDKAEVLRAALAGGPVEQMPVRAVLRQSQVPVTVFWSP